jgi:hypothetical protein
MRHLLASAVVLAVALTAGCSGIVAGPDADRGPETATVTPVDVPEVRTQVAPGVWPPGSADQPARPVQTDRLVAANARVRANTSYRLERVVRIESREDGGRMVIRRSRRVGDDGSVAESLVATGTSPLQPTVRNSTFWRDDDTTATRARLAGGRTVTVQRLPGPPTRHSIGLDLAERVLTDSEFDVRAAGIERTRLVVDGRVSLAQSEVPVAVGPPQNVTASLVVRRDGLVTGLRVSYETVYLDDPVEVTISHRLYDLGNTSVRRPGWVDSDESRG